MTDLWDEKCAFVTPLLQFPYQIQSPKFKSGNSIPKANETPHTSTQKNKSAKVQKEVQKIQQQASMAGKSPAVLAKEKERDLRAKEKLDAEKRAREEAALLKPVTQMQKVPFGVDPKTVLCQFFKAGHCEKGTKCKFSHNLDVERKVEKKNLYADTREEKEAGEFWHAS